MAELAVDDTITLGADAVPAAANAPIAAQATVVTPAATPAAVNIADDAVPLGVLDDEDDEADVVNIEDEETPLAANAQTKESAARRFWWWVLAIIGSITGKISYDKKNKKNLFAERTPEEREDDK